MSTNNPPPEPAQYTLLKEIPTHQIIDALLERRLLSRREAHTLKAHEDLSSLYEGECDCGCPGAHGDDSFNERAAEYVRELIMRGDLAEALVQAERVHPHLDGLVRLSQRGA